MNYFLFKMIHIISSSVLFGTGLGTAFYMWYANRSRNIHVIAHATKQVVFADWVFTGTSGVVQFITGLALIYIKDYSFTQAWIWISILAYGIALACWLPVVYLQIQCRNIAFAALNNNTPLPSIYYRLYRTWWILGIPAFSALLLVYYLMTNRPALMT